MASEAEERRGSSERSEGEDEAQDKSEGNKKSNSSSFGDYSEWSEDPFTLFFKKKTKEKQ